MKFYKLTVKLLTISLCMFYRILCIAFLCFRFHEVFRYLTSWLFSEYRIPQTAMLRVYEIHLDNVYYFRSYLTDETPGCYLATRLHGVIILRTTHNEPSLSVPYLLLPTRSSNVNLNICFHISITNEVVKVYSAH
jgi:hypothetical protein